MTVDAEVRTSAGAGDLGTDDTATPWLQHESSLHAGRSNVALDRALERWNAAAGRLGLEPAATACGALLLAAELDMTASIRLVGRDSERIAPRRLDLLRVLGAEFGEEAALAGLAGLETRSVAAPFDSYAGPWLMAELTLAKQVRQYCLGASSAPRADHACAILPRIARWVDHVVQRCRTNPESYLIVLRGRRGSGRDTLLGELAHRLGVEPLVKGVFELRQSADSLEPELSRSAPVWDGRRADPGADDHEIARRWLRRSKTVCFAVVDAHQDCPEVEGRLVVRIDADPVDLDERRLAWTAALAAAGVVPELGAGAAVLLAARNQAGIGLATHAALLSRTDSARDCRELVAHVESALLTLVQPSSLRGICVEQPDTPLARVIAPERVTGALRRLVLLCSSHAEVAGSGRRGAKALFSGPSGTGKTLAARAIAHSVGRVLYRVDLASVVSKWIGETEKNLRDAMIAAAAVGAVLLFDEGDALFGKRGEVSRGTDRYANMEVSYLLQAIEDYDGIAIVTTNLRGNVDKAFERRFDTCIEFPQPGIEQRALIWRQELGEAGAALAEPFILELAQRADLSGGSIAAAARLARVLAFERGETSLVADDVQLAVEDEFVKQGSTVRAHNWTQQQPTRRRG